MNQERRRPNIKVSAELVNYLRILEIEDVSSIPKMKTVRKQFIKLSKARHPDKGMGSSEDFADYSRQRNIS